MTLLSLVITSLGFAQQSCEAILKSVNDLQKQTITKMKANTNKAKNDALFDAFYKEADKKLTTIETNDTYEYPASLTPYINKEKGTFVASFRKLLDSYGLTDAWNEGFAGFYFKKGYLQNIFKDYLSEEYLLYLKATEIRPFMYNDAALTISWKELGDLVLSESDFIEKFPSSSKIEEIKVNYASDLTTFILGADNTPSTDFPEARKTMKAFVKQHPKALATPIVNLYLQKTQSLVNKKGAITITEYEKYNNLNLYELISKGIEKQTGIKD